LKAGKFEKGNVGGVVGKTIHPVNLEDSVSVVALLVGSNNAFLPDHLGRLAGVMLNAGAFKEGTGETRNVGSICMNFGFFGDID